MRRFALTAALLFALAPAAQAAKKPDLTISKAAMAGTTVTWTVKSAGAAAKASTTGLVLSTDAKLDKTDVKLGSASQKAIKKGKTGTGKLVVKTPTGLAAGRYTVLVCADSANKVKESKETNNCRAASSMTIAAPPAGGGTTPRPTHARPGGGAPAPGHHPAGVPADGGADRDAHRHGDRHGHAGAVLHPPGRVPRRHLPAAERALRVQRQRGRRRLRVPAGRRGVRRVHLAGRDQRHPRRRARVRGPRQARRHVRGRRAQGVADRVRGARARPDRRGRRRARDEGVHGRRRRDHARRRHHRVPLHGHDPDPEGGRAGRHRDRARGRPARQGHPPQRHADRGCADHGRRP